PLQRTGQKSHDLLHQGGHLLSSIFPHKRRGKLTPFEGALNGQKWERRFHKGSYWKLHKGVQYKGAPLQQRAGRTAEKPDALTLGPAARHLRQTIRNKTLDQDLCKAEGNAGGFFRKVSGRPNSDEPLRGLPALDSGAAQPRRSEPGKAAVRREPKLAGATRAESAKAGKALMGAFHSPVKVIIIPTSFSAVRCVVCDAAKDPGGSPRGQE
ncbi:MAG: hypothetical protein ACLGH7_05855, partial [Actinomycetes bacterium]